MDIMFSSVHITFNIKITLGSPNVICMVMNMSIKVISTGVVV